MSKAGCVSKLCAVEKSMRTRHSCLLAHVADSSAADIGYAYVEVQLFVFVNEWRHADGTANACSCAKFAVSHLLLGNKTRILFQMHSKDNWDSNVPNSIIDLEGINEKDFS